MIEEIIIPTSIGEAAKRLSDTSYPITFVQGVGGTGKSTLYKMLQEMNPNTLCLASTGIAAQNLMSGGVLQASTIHSAFNLPPVDVYPFHTRQYTANKDLLNSIEIILIDEISLVQCSLMDWILQLVETATKRNRFIRLIIFGDILQLPPVLRMNTDTSKIWETKYGKNKFFFNARNFQRTATMVCLLTRIFRQEEPHFALALSSLRSRNPPMESLEMINSRVCSIDDYKEDHDVQFLTIVATNKEKDAINNIEISQLAAQETLHEEFIAEAEGNLDWTLLNAIPKILNLYVGEKVICTANSENYRNGTLGTVIGFSDDSGLPVIRTSEGIETVIDYHEYNQYMPIIRIDGSLEYEISGSVCQIALQPAYATTIHKTQGLTLDSIYLKMGSWLPYSGIYVALSRCRSLDGIGLNRPISQKDIKYDPEAMAFYEDLLAA